MSRLVIVALVALWVGRAAAAPPEVVGDVSAKEDVAETLEDGAFRAVKKGVASGKVYCPGGVRTDSNGKVQVLFIPRDSDVTLGPGTELRFDWRQDTHPAGKILLRELNLSQGRILVVHTPGADCRGKTPNGGFRCKGTKFIVEYHPETKTTDVIVVSGAVEVWSTETARRRAVVVGPQERTSLVGSNRPTPPRQVDEQTLREVLASFEFIGRGIPESLVPGMRPDVDTGPLPRPGPPHVPTAKSPGDILGPPLAPPPTLPPGD